MKQTITLLKVFFKQNYRRKSSAERSKKGKIGMALLYIFCFIVIAPYLLFTLYSLAKMAVEFDAGREYISIVMLAVQSLALVFGTITLVNSLFFSKDGDIIASLPISARKVFSARFSYAVLHELMFSAVIGISGVVMFGVLSGSGVAYYLLGTIAMFVAPVISLAVSSILLFPILIVASYLRRHPVLSGMFAVGVFGGAMYLYMQFIMGVSVSSSNGNVQQVMTTLFQNIASGLFFNMYIADVVFLVEGFGLSLLIGLCIYVGMFAVAMGLTLVVYSRGRAFSTDRVEKIAIKSSGEQNGMMKALILRDIKSILRFPMLMYMCGSQLVIAPVMIFAMSVAMPREIPEMQVGMNFMMGCMFVCGMNYFATSSFTRENNNFNILKTLPVSAEDIVLSKYFLAVAVGQITNILVCGVMIAMGGDLLISALIFLFYIPLVFAMCALQVRTDLDKPKLGYTNINEGLKNNKASIMPLFVMMGVGMIGMFAMMFFQILGKSWIIYAGLGLAICISGIVAILGTKSLISNAERLLSKVEN